MADHVQHVAYASHDNSEVDQRIAGGSKEFCDEKLAKFPVTNPNGSGYVRPCTEAELK